MVLRGTNHLRNGLFGALCVLLGCLLLSAAPAGAQQAARELFSAKSTPTADGRAAPIGSYAKGCLAGGAALATDGATWQAMRLSRNRNWGHPVLIGFIEKLAADAARADGWRGLLVGDMSQPRGGPMNGGHASHQIGLDVDIWLTPMPDRTLSGTERESIGATSMIGPGRRIDRGVWTEAHALLIRRAAVAPEVARIFVHPGIKQALCAVNWRDRSFLRKVRPWWGHDSHFHVRLACPAGAAGCTDQAPPPPGDGCGEDLDWWLSEGPWTPKDPPDPPAPPLTLADLPAACRGVLGD